jgi:enoyl-CoA hydratase/carnithine racemase
MPSARGFGPRDVRVVRGAARVPSRRRWNTRLVNICGVGVAMQMVLTAEPIDAHRALQCNMVTKVVPHQALIEEAELLARQTFATRSWQCDQRRRPFSR